MKKIILFLMIFIFSIIGGKSMVMYENIQDCFNKADKIHLIINNKEEWLDVNDEKYQKIIFYIERVLIDSHQMPALSVSLDSETREVMKKGIWLEFVFNKEGINNDLPFNALLIEVNKDHEGFNIIRKYNNKYEGRCFYINLANKNMSELYNYLVRE